MGSLGSTDGCEARSAVKLGSTARPREARGAVRLGSTTCPREARGAVRLGSTTCPCEARGAVRLLFSPFSSPFLLLLFSFRRTLSTKVTIPLLRSPALHHLLMVPYTVTRRVSSARRSTAAGASQSSRGVQSTLRVLPPHSGLSQ